MKLIDNSSLVQSKLKSFKIVHIFPNGSIYFDSLAYLKSYKKYHFSKESFFSNPFYKKKLTSKNSNFLYKKYRNQIVKILLNYELTIIYKNYSKCI